MELEFWKDETNGDWVCELTELTEPECDVARNRSVGIQASKAGAIGWGTSYHANEGEFSASVRATEKEIAEQAAKAYYEAIQDALDS